MAYKNMTKDEFHEFITKLYYWATSYFPEEMRNQTYELLLTLLDTYYPSDGNSKPSTENDCNMPLVNHCNLNPKTIDLAHQIALRLLGSKEWQKLPKNEIPTIAAMIENCCG